MDAQMQDLALPSARSQLTMREFFAAPPLAAVTLLVANDHFLKARFHNAVSGKLSDLAICFAMPLFLSASLESVTSLAPRARLAAGALATVAVFSALKVSPAVAEVYCRVLDAAWSWAGLQFHAVADRTDLFCLPMTLIAVLYGWRRTAGVDP